MSNVSDFVQSRFAAVVARSENFVAGRFWSLEVVFLALLYSVLFSGGVDGWLWKIGDGYPAIYYAKIEHPLLNTGQVMAESHDAKINFRLTIPVILHALHVPTQERWVLPALTAFATAAILWLACQFTFQITGDRICALFVTLGISATYIGSLAFTRYYDAIAISQLLLAMLPGVPKPLKAALIFTASFTDERALLAATLLLVQNILPVPNSAMLRPRFLNGNVLAILTGMFGYGVVRFLLAHYAGLSSPTGHVGLEVMMDNFPLWPAGVWFALKGGWLLIVLALAALWQRRKFFPFFVFGANIALVVAAGFVVYDVVRSTSYVLPALLIALAVLKTNDKIQTLRACCLAAFVISAVTGNFNVWMGHVTWFEPLAAKFLHYIFHLFTHAEAPAFQA